MIGCGANIFPAWLRKGGGPAPSTLLNGLVSYWSLDELSGTRADSVVASGNDLTDNNTVGYSLAGPSGTVASFVGTNNESLTGGTPNDFPGNFSVNVWANLPGYAGYTSIIASEDSSYYAWRLLAGDGGLYFQMADGAGNNAASVHPTTPVANLWQMFTLTYDAAVGTYGTMTIYVNGVAQGSPTALTLAPADVSGGTYNIGGAFYGDEVVGRAGVWHTALSSTLVGTLFNSGNGKAYADLTAAEKVGLVSYWNLDEPGGVRYDSAGTNDLTDNNTVNWKLQTTPVGTVAAPAAAGQLNNASFGADITNGWSAAGWVYVPTVDATYKALINKMSATQDWQLYNYSTYFNLDIWDTDGNPVSVNTNGIFALQSGEWHFVSITFDAATKKGAVSIDAGTPVESAALAANPRNDTETLNIGGANGGQQWTGQMSRFGFWNKKLSNAERLLLFNGGRGLLYSELTTGLKSSLVSYWNLDETGNVNRADSAGTTTLTPSGTFGSSQAFNGAGAMHNVAASFVAGNSENLTCGDLSSTSDYFINFWVKVADATATEGLFGIGDTNSYYQTHNPIIFRQSSALQFAIGDGYPVGGHYQNGAISDGAVPWTGVWHMVSAKFVASTQVLSVSVDNGAWTSLPSLGFPPLTGSLTTRIGSWGAANFFTGQIDEPAIWSRVLTPDERTELYNAGAGKFYPF